MSDTNNLFLLTALEKAIFEENLSFNELMERFSEYDKHLIVDLWGKLKNEKTLQNNLNKINKELSEINYKGNLLRELRKFNEKKDELKNDIIKWELEKENAYEQWKTLINEVNHLSSLKKILLEEGFIDLPQMAFRECVVTDVLENLDNIVFYSLHKFLRQDEEWDCVLETIFHPDKTGFSRTEHIHASTIMHNLFEQYKEKEEFPYLSLKHFLFKIKSKVYEDIKDRVSLELKGNFKQHLTKTYLINENIPKNEEICKLFNVYRDNMRKFLLDRAFYEEFNRR